MNRNIDISKVESEAIEQYLQHQMTVEEKEAFTKKLSTDLALQHKLETVKLLILGIQESELEKKLEEFHNNVFSSKKSGVHLPTKIFAVKKWLVAASVLVIVGLSSLLFLNRDSKEEKIFASYYQPDSGLISAMSTTNNYLFDRAMVDYKSGQYDAAINTWESMLISKLGNDTLNYFIGSAYLAKGEIEQALTHFQEVIAKPNSYFYDDALWYTGLSFLKESKTKEAISAIEKSEHYNKEILLLKLKEVE